MGAHLTTHHHHHDNINQMLTRTWQKSNSNKAHNNKLTLRKYVIFGDSSIKMIITMIICALLNDWSMRVINGHSLIHSFVHSSSGRRYWEWNSRNLHAQFKWPEASE